MGLSEVAEQFKQQLDNVFDGEEPENLEYEDPVSPIEETTITEPKEAQEEIVKEAPAPTETVTTEEQPPEGGQPEQPVEEQEESPEETIQALRAQLVEAYDQMSKMLQVLKGGPIPAQQGGVQPMQPQTAPQVQQPVVQPPGPSTPQRFLSDEEYAEAMDSPEGMNNVLNKVYHNMLEQARRDMVEVQQILTDRAVTFRSHVEDFVRNNPDLALHKGVNVGVLNELHAGHPDWDFDQLFRELPKEVRKRLRLVPPTQKQAQKGNFARGTTTRKPVSQTPQRDPVSEYRKLFNDL